MTKNLGVMREFLTSIHQLVEEKKTDIHQLAEEKKTSIRRLVKRQKDELTTHKVKLASSFRNSEAK